MHSQKEAKAMFEKSCTPETVCEQKQTLLA